MRISLVAFLLCAAAACQQGKSKLDDTPAAAKTTTASPSGSGTHPGSAATPAEPAEDIDSKDILARTDTAPSVYVKHVLIGWKGTAGKDPRSKDRTNADAAQLARDIAGKLKANPGSIDDLVKQYSEDPGSLKGEPYQVKADTPFVPEFKNLALRLKENEIGIVKTAFGYHVMERVPAPPPDPMESAAILARPEEAGPAYIQYLVIGWKDAPQAIRGVSRSKADADKLAKDTVDKAMAGGDFDKLIADTSDIPGAKDKKEVPVEIQAKGRMPDELKTPALRLKLNEAGMFKTGFGWLVMKRVAAPPPDALESADILKREPVTQKAKVKHILLGWTEVHAEDPRGKSRSRADLEKLVKDTVAKLQKGDKIEPLMASLSEDPGSAKDGKSYDVSADAALVEPFKNLSLRLKVGEVGVVKTEFGIHIIQRVE
ncbi:MAG TPA: peptidylprolyl isomerase [Kofleriaceae bacterium]|nr:peptidylprolyl isomerase [Kofleriaceae bacterium]